MGELFCADIHVYLKDVLLITFLYTESSFEMTVYNNIANKSILKQDKSVSQYV